MNGVVGLETPRSGLASLAPRRLESEQGRVFCRVRIEVLQSIEALVARGQRVIVVAERPGVAEWTACALRDRYGLLAVGVAAPGVPENGQGPWVERLIDRIALTRPDLVLVAMATPKQELFCQYAAARLQPAVLVGIGAALESAWDEARPVHRWREQAGHGWLDRCRRWLTAPVRLLRQNLSFLRILAGSRR